MRKPLISMPIPHSWMLLLAVVFIFQPWMVQARKMDLSKKYPELKSLIMAGAKSIATMEYDLNPGWWQWNQSCDRNKWISYGQKFEPRKDFRASCEQQKHDFQTVVLPTLSKTVEVEVPGSGRIIVASELRRSKDYGKEPAVSVMIIKSDSSENPASCSLMGRVSHDTDKKVGEDPKVHLRESEVKKGDKVRVHFEAGWYAVFHTRAIPTQGARAQVFFIPAEIAGEDDPCKAYQKTIAKYEYIKRMTQNSIDDLKKQIDVLNKPSPFNTGCLNEYQNNVLGNDPNWGRKNLKILKYGCGGGTVSYLYDKDKWKRQINKSIRLQKENLKKTKKEIARIKREMKKLKCK